MPIYMKANTAAGAPAANSTPWIRGDVTQTPYREWVAVDGVSWGTESDTSVSPGGVITAGRLTSKQLVLTTAYSRASIELFRRQALGTSLPSLALAFTKTDGAVTIEYLSIVLSRVFVAGWAIAADGPNPSEIWSLSFGAITQNYRHKRLTDGVYLAPVSITYDAERNTVT